MKKRFLTLSIVLIALFLSSCDSPLSNIGGKNQPSLVPNNTATAIPPGTPKAKADLMRKVLWQQFEGQNGSQWRIHWGNKTDLPVSMFFGKTKKAYHGSAKQAARAFLSDHTALLGFGSLKNLHYLRTTTVSGIRYVCFNQTVKGVPVYEAQYVVQLTKRGHVDMVNGHYYPNIQVSTTPSVPTSQAIGIARSNLRGILPNDLHARTKLIIYNGKKRFHLAWKVELFSQKAVIDLLFIVDAHSGSVLYEANLVDYYFTPTMVNTSTLYNISSSSTIENNPLSNNKLVTGDGNVYPTYPPNSSPTDVSLYRLNGNGYLDGKYAKIVNDKKPRAYSASGSFQYGKHNTHFDEVNLYYHIDLFRHSFVNTYTSNIGFEPIIAHAHAIFPKYCKLKGKIFVCGHQKKPNAVFDPYNKELYFSDTHNFPKYNDFAKSDQVIYHEYSHAVISVLNPSIESSDDEEGAISEGLPDYWAGTKTGRAIIGNYVSDAKDGHHPDKVRNMNNPDISSYIEYENKYYSNNPNGVKAHKGGEFFSSILWDLRSTIGAQKTNRLTFMAIASLSDPTFFDFRNAMMSADRNKYDGTDIKEIINAFAARGIGNPIPDLTVNITGDIYLYSGEKGTWFASVPDNAENLTYSWSKEPAGSSYSLQNSTTVSKDKFIELPPLEPIGSSYSTTFYNNSSISRIAHVKVTVTSGGQAVTDRFLVEIYPADSRCNGNHTVTPNFRKPLPCDDQ